MDLHNYSRFKQYLSENMMAIDYGTKVTGLAFFCPGNDPLPYPFTRLIYQNDDKLLKDIAILVVQENVSQVIIGIPHLLDGKETQATLKIKGFGLRLQEMLAPIEVHFQDETLSTFEAESRMKEDPRYNFKVDLKKIDMLCACIILEDFIRGERRNTCIKS